MATRLKFCFVCLLFMSTMPGKSQTFSKNSAVRYLALGDSYTIGESVAEVQRWPVQLMEAFKGRGYTCEAPEIIAVTGWRTDDLRNAIRAKNPHRGYDLVSLLIGVNNQYQGRSVSEYEKEFDALLDIAIVHAQKEKFRVIVLSIPDYGYTPFGREKQDKISEQIDTFNAVNKRITLKKGVAYIDITDISRMGLKQPDLVADDGLHPSGKMYAMWVDRIMQQLNP